MPSSASRLRRSLHFPVPLKVVPNNLSLIVCKLDTLRCMVRSKTETVQPPLGFEVEKRCAVQSRLSL